jgi:hypothetical protein
LAIVGGPVAAAATAAAPLAPAAAGGPARAGGAPPPGTDDAAGPGLALRIDEVVLEDGSLRFVDRGTTPFYSEELSRLAIRLRELTTAPGGQARLEVQGTVGATGTLDLAGRIAPFGDPFFLELAGDLREFPLPRTNPMFRRMFAWLLRRGSLTTRVHYRIVGDQLEALHDVQVARLGVERDRQPEAGGKLALPLGMIVAIATDARGDIAFPLAVRGRLGSPEFSLGGAVWAAIRNALVNLVAGPVRGIGRVFGGGEEPETVRLDPLEFPAGIAVLDAGAERHLQRIADFLRSAPNVALVLRPVVGEADLVSLRTREVTARIQQVQREAGLDGFEAAAVRVFRDAFPDRPEPAGVEQVVDALREREPVPDAAAGRLAAERLAAVREALAARAGIEPGRLREAAAGPASDTRDGRIEFELAP